jgi:hypothetical protein
MTKHTLQARIALLLTLAALVPLAGQNEGSGAALLNVGEYSKFFLMPMDELRLNILERLLTKTKLDYVDLVAMLKLLILH